MKRDDFQQTQNIGLPELKCLISWIKSQKDQSSTFDFYLFIITIKLIIFLVQFCELCYEVIAFGASGGTVGIFPAARTRYDNLLLF